MLKWDHGTTESSEVNDSICPENTILILGNNNRPNVLNTKLSKGALRLKRNTLDVNFLSSAIRSQVIDGRGILTFWTFDLTSEVTRWPRTLNFIHQSLRLVTSNMLAFPRRSGWLIFFNWTQSGANRHVVVPLCRERMRNAARVQAVSAHGRGSEPPSHCREGGTYVPLQANSKTTPT